MKVTTDNDTMVLCTSHRKKEILFSLSAIGITILILLLFYGLSWLLRIGFILLVIFTAAVNISDEEECKINKKKGEIIIRRWGPLTGERLYVKELDTLTDAVVEKLPKKPQYSRVVLVFKDGLRLPVTDAFFTIKVNVQQIATDIATFANL